MTENTRQHPATEHPALQLSLFTPTLHLVLCHGKRAIERGWQLRMPTADALGAHVDRGGHLGYIPASVSAPSPRPSRFAAMRFSTSAR